MARRAKYREVRSNALESPVPLLDDQIEFAGFGEVAERPTNLPGANWNIVEARL
jgi:hypothetical protein